MKILKSPDPFEIELVVDCKCGAKMQIEASDFKYGRMPEWTVRNPDTVFYFSLKLLKKAILRRLYCLEDKPLQLNLSSSYFFNNSGRCIKKLN